MTTTTSSTRPPIRNAEAILTEMEHVNLELGLKEALLKEIRLKYEAALEQLNNLEKDELIGECRLVDARIKGHAANRSHSLKLMREALIPTLSETKKFESLTREIKELEDIIFSLEEELQRAQAAQSSQESEQEQPQESEDVQEPEPEEETFEAQLEKALETVPVLQPEDIAALTAKDEGVSLEEQARRQQSIAIVISAEEIIAQAEPEQPVIPIIPPVPTKKWALAPAPATSGTVLVGGASYPEYGDIPAGYRLTANPNATRFNLEFEFEGTWYFYTFPNGKKYFATNKKAAGEWVREKAKKNELPYLVQQLIQQRQQAQAS